MTALQEFVEQKRQLFFKARQESNFDETHWEQRVQELYQQIIDWLTPLAENNLLIFRHEAVPSGRYVAVSTNRTNGKVNFFEEHLADSLVIQFFNGETIKFIPVGANIIDAYGRVDMRLGLRTVMLVLQEKEGKWLLAERYSRTHLETYEFNRDNFEEIITEFVENF